MKYFLASRHNLLFIFSFSASVFFSTISAQTEQFITLSTSFSLTQKQQEMREKVMKNSFFKNVQFVTLGNLPSIQKSGVLKFTIPGRLGIIEARAKKVKAKSLTNYEWYGEINNGLGYVIVINHNGKITASISLPDSEVYEIFYTDTDKYLIVQYNNEKLLSGKCGNEQLPLEDKEGTSLINKAAAPVFENVPFNNHRFTNDYFTEVVKGPNSSSTEFFLLNSVEPCGDRTRVLVLYTPNAAAAVASISQAIDLCISNFNAAISNSSITGDAYVELAGIQQLDLIETSIDEDLTILRTNATVQALRNSTYADMVILLTDGPYGDVYGQVDIVGPDEPRAYGIVEAERATSSEKVFTHEVGHLFGARHNDDAYADYQRGRIFYPIHLPLAEQ